MKIKIVILAFLSFAVMQAQSDILTQDILIMNDSIKLPGTLTYKSMSEPQPLVIFVHGSGNVDRNGNQAMMNSKANYIKMLNDSLVTRGIAFYSFDKRSATPSNIKFMMTNMSFDAFVDDINLILNHFKNDKRFSTLTLIGHSQGSLVAMLSDQNHFDKYISLAGTSESFDKTIIKQVRQQNGDSIAQIVTSHFKELSETGVVENVDPNLLSLFNKPTQPFLKSWMKYNPSTEIKNMKLPILILNGTADIQVPVIEAKNLHDANPSSKLVIIDKMNHVLKTVENEEENKTSYASPDFELSKILVETIEAFIKK